jgi:hypothetical protein
METVEVMLPADLVRAAGRDVANPSLDASRLLALELYREERVSAQPILRVARDTDEAQASRSWLTDRIAPQQHPMRTITSFIIH